MSEGKSAMNTKLLSAALLAVYAAGCTNLERSRDIGDARVSGQTLAIQVCSNCHGMTGNSVSPNFPKLAGQRPEYLIVQLTAFRAHERMDPAGFAYMWGVSRKLTDQQIRELADYYAQEALVPEPVVTGPLPALGQSIFEKGIGAAQVPPCQTCHGVQGQGTGGNAPQLAGQYANYIVKQLEVFQRTDLRPEGAAMKQVCRALTPEDMLAVASYLQGLPPQR